MSAFSCEQDGDTGLALVLFRERRRRILACACLHWLFRFSPGPAAVRFRNLRLNTALSMLRALAAHSITPLEDSRRSHLLHAARTPQSACNSAAFNRLLPRLRNHATIPAGPPGRFLSGRCPRTSHPQYLPNFGVCPLGANNDRGPMARPIPDTLPPCGLPSHSVPFNDPTFLCFRNGSPPPT
jgi:hypothetical protein